MILSFDSKQIQPASLLERIRERPAGVSRVLVSTVQIQQRVGELARRISRDYADTENLLLVGILRGAFIFLADLTRELSIAHTVDFMSLTSYGMKTSAGEVRLLMDLRESIQGQHVMIVEDIVDRGHTLDYLRRLLLARQPASLRTCAMVRKNHSSQRTAVDYLGFEIPDVWVVGYGLDYANRHRTLPYIAELDPMPGANDREGRV